MLPDLIDPVRRISRRTPEDRKPTLSMVRCA
jgi:hypothetical protein